METELAAIPDDALADALRRLPARSLAAARCVCKCWRGVVDGRGLLLPHLLPHSVRGIFINYIDHHRPHLFARPSSSAAAASPEIDAMLGFLPSNDRDCATFTNWWSVMDHCDGLLICDIKWESRLCVCNPATRRWTLLPLRAEGLLGYAGAHLMFDPAVSPHYEVVLIPAVPKEPLRPYDWKVKRKKRQCSLPPQHEIDGPFCIHSLFSSPDDTLLPDDETQQDGEEFQPAMEWRGDEEDEDEEEKEPDDPYRLMEWPPSPWQLNVFSSRTGQWEARHFIREGEPVGTVEDMRLDERLGRMCRRCTVYHNGALYVHCQGPFIMRLSLSSDKYQVINTPTNIERAKPYLGRSEKEVHFGTVHEGQLQVWILKESHKKIEWILKYQNDLRCYAQYVASLYNHGRLMVGPWIIKEHNSSVHTSNHTAETLSKEGFEWDSDNDDIISANVGGEANYWESFDIIGFHPYKKVVFLAEPFDIVAYHMNTTKAQYLGNSRPNCYYHNYTNGIYESFVYTPCTIGELEEGNIDLSAYKEGNQAM
ncbi:unnamed protein product [Urochloa decumbens]|uniref:F-box domain-containing protein n=1 Tax=Urochloa decumbens TaxID=240449 RepID=A0ABC9D4F5_9POAL